jgi:hypothetical protein
MHHIRDKAHPKGMVFHSRSQLKDYCEHNGLEADVIHN